MLTSLEAVALLAAPYFIEDWAQKLNYGMERKLSEDWQEQSDVFGSRIIPEYEVMISAACMLCADQRYNAVIAACDAIGRGLCGLFEVYGFSYNILYDELHASGLSDDYQFPMPPPRWPTVTNYLTGDPAKTAMEGMQALHKSWAAHEPERVVYTRCILASLACPWLTAVMEQIADARDPVAKQLAAHELRRLQSFEQKTSKFWGYSGENCSVPTLAALAEELGYDLQQPGMAVARKLLVGA